METKREERGRRSEAEREREGEREQERKLVGSKGERKRWRAT